MTLLLGVAGSGSAESERCHMVIKKTSTATGTARRSIREVIAVQGQVHQPHGDAMRLAKLWVWNPRL